MTNNSIILKNKTYMKIWLAQLISLFGDIFYDVAIVWYLIEETGSALVAGGIAIFSILGKLVGSFFINKFIDAYPSRKIMVLADLIRGVILLFIINFIGKYEISVYTFYFLSFVITFLTACFTPARNKSVVEIVDKNDITNANAFDGISSSIVQILSWGLGGYVVSQFGVKITLIIDCISFFVSLGLIYSAAWVCTTEVKEHIKESSILKSMNIIKSNYILKNIVLFEVLYLTMLGLYWSSLPLKIDNIGNAFYYGLQGTAFGIGSLITAMYISKLKVSKIGLMYVVGIIIHLFGNFIGGISGNINIFIFGVFIAGLGSSYWEIARTSVYQTSVNKLDYGKTISFIEILSSFSLMVSWVIGGYLADKYTPSIVMTIACVLQLILFLILIVPTKIRNIEI